MVMVSWLERDAPAQRLDEQCSNCGRFVYTAEKRVSEGALCSGCGNPQQRCFCLPLNFDLVAA